MDRNTIIEYKSSFDSIATFIEGEYKEQVEIWFARDLQAVLGYSRWENFHPPYSYYRCKEPCH